MFSCGTSPIRCRSSAYAGQRPEQRRLARAAGPDDAKQAALAQRKADVVQDYLAARQPDCQAAGAERDVAGVDELQ